MKKLFRTLFAAALCCLTFKATDACTNFIITRGASSDGSVMVSYAADSHQLYGALYKTFAGRYKPGTGFEVDSTAHLRNNYRIEGVPFANHIAFLNGIAVVEEKF